MAPPTATPAAATGMTCMHVATMMSVCCCHSSVESHSVCNAYSCAAGQIRYQLRSRAVPADTSPTDLCAPHTTPAGAPH
jgi:hypothetical protein